MDTAQNVFSILQQREFCIDKSFAGQRLDFFLSFFFPDLGLRGRRRLWQTWNICINGRPKKNGYLVQAGDLFCLRPKGGERFEAVAAGGLNRLVPRLSSADGVDCACLESLVRESSVLNTPVLLHQKGPWRVYYKPHGLHTVCLAGSAVPSLEDFVRERNSNRPRAVQYPGRSFFAGGQATLPLMLLSRLDAVTAGLVLACVDEQSRDLFRQLERAGSVEKTYFALVHGHMPGALLLDRALDTARRKKTVLLDCAAAEQTRYSRCTPLCFVNKTLFLQGLAALLPTCFSENAGLDVPEALTPQADFALDSAVHLPQPPEDDFPMTLLQVRIQRGARHQIRAHLAGAGFPILGEFLYASEGSRRAEKSILRFWNESVLGTLRSDQFPAAHLLGALPLFLHHAQLTFPGLHVDLVPDWVKKLGFFKVQ